ncbi:trypsin 3A1-like isoform X2 [Euwallacea fornicatus]|uniref:trypsin 3A1-like isoform X2 n=1 Tax=Euwallacea fornicatus TaxID=995702 RepID=UPI00338DC72E
MLMVNFLVVALCGLQQTALALPLSPTNRTDFSFVRIVGGQDANITDYPYQVSILIDGQHACGGSILTTTHILSAAHCFVDESRVSHITIRAGSSSRTSGGQILATKKINSHHDFNMDTYDYDVAVLELATPLIFGTGVQPIPLPAASTTFPNGQSSVVTGWGLTSNNGDLASILQMVTVPLITTSTCQAGAYGNAISPRMICAGGEAGKDSCTVCNFETFIQGVWNFSSLESNLKRLNLAN